MRAITASGALVLLAACWGAAPTAKSAPASLSQPAAQQKKDYLTDTEADKIRDAGLTGPRIVLYATFASDRIKKLQYEFAHMDPADQKRTERLNSLINGYAGCIDDAADLIDLGIEKQEDIREGVKMLQSRLKEFLPYLQELAEKGPERDSYKDNLDDAIEATQDAQKDVEKAAQEMAPPPVSAQTIMIEIGPAKDDQQFSSLLVGGDRIFQRIFTRLGCHGRPPQFHVELYPYANLSHTLRLRNDVARARISDILRDAPIPVIEAAAAILLGQMYRRRVPGELRELYREFAMNHSTRRRIDRVRRKRARRIVHDPRGAAHDLAPMFAALNAEYFGGNLRRPRLGWSKRPWSSQFGCFDPSLKQIVMNRRLDRPDVPSYAVEFILYHEMLHVKFPLRAAACGLQAHSPEFRAEEKRFADYVRARKFLEHLR